MHSSIGGPAIEQAPPLGWSRKTQRALAGVPDRRFTDGRDIVPHVPPWIWHYDPPPRLGPPGGIFTDHKGALYLERIEAWQKTTAGR